MKDIPAAEDAEQLLESEILNYGPLKELVAHHGESFIATVFQYFCSILSIKKNFTETYYNQTNEFGSKRTKLDLIRFVGGRVWG